GRGEWGHLKSKRFWLRGGEEPARSDEVYVDCTAAGVRPTKPRPVFEPGRITMQYVTIGIVPWSAATIGAGEALRGDDQVKNRLCQPVVYTGNTSDLLALVY